MRCAGFLAAAALALSSCRGTPSREPDTTVPTAAPTSATTTTSAVSYEVPAVIDAPYIAKVMSALDRIFGDTARYMAAHREIDEEFLRYLVASYGGESFILKQQVWGQVIAGQFRLLRPQPGDARTAVGRVLLAEPGCVLFEASRDFFAIFNEPDPPGSPRYVGLVPLPPDRDLAHHNPTPWLITFDGRMSDGSEPERAVACTAP